MLAIQKKKLNKPIVFEVKLMSYSFRIKFILPESAAIGIDSSQWIIDDSKVEPRVILRSVGNDVAIKNSRSLFICGQGYKTEEEALIQGNLYQDMFMLACSYLRIGVDFGDRTPKDVLTEAGLQILEKESKDRILNDVHGLMTFETNPPPKFATMKAKIVLTKPHDKLQRALNYLFKLSPKVTDKERLAFDLFSASFFQPSADARFLMLMMAIETLIEQVPRSALAKDHVDNLINGTQKCPYLTRDEKNSFIGSLQWLYKESIGQGGRRLVERLGDRKYDNKTPKQFFTQCYTLRSNLVHGFSPRPTYDEVGRTAAALEGLVGDLLCGPLLSSEQ